MLISQKNNSTLVFSTIVLLSAAILCFLFWLIYFKTGAAVDQKEGWVSLLPFLNAFLNALTAFLLVLGYIFIKKNERDLHIKTMIAATTTSAAFLVSYVTYHHFQGDTKFMGTGAIRAVYFFILITHILLSMVQVPLILTTLYLAAAKKYERHRKWARITFPIWLYVSVTGVLIFAILKTF